MTHLQPNPNLKPFGHFLALDLYNVQKGLCDDTEFTYRFLEALVIFLDMTPMAPPYVIHAPSKITIEEGITISADGPVETFDVSQKEVYPDKAGVSAWQPLIESGIQIHTLSPKNFVSIDIYTCGKLEIDKLKAFVEFYYKPTKIDTQYLVRGVEY